jgi:hypothetical protein
VEDSNVGCWRLLEIGFVADALKKYYHVRMAMGTVLPAVLLCGMCFFIITLV